MQNLQEISRAAFADRKVYDPEKLVLVGDGKAVVIDGNSELVLVCSSGYLSAPVIAAHNPSNGVTGMIVTSPAEGDQNNPFTSDSLSQLREMLMSVSSGKSQMVQLRIIGPDQQLPRFLNGLEEEGFNMNVLSVNGNRNAWPKVFGTSPGTFSNALILGSAYTSGSGQILSNDPDVLRNQVEEMQRALSDLDEATPPAGEGPFHDLRAG